MSSTSGFRITFATGSATTRESPPSRRTWRNWTQDLLIHRGTCRPPPSLQVPKSWQAGHRSDFRSFKAPRLEPASVPELHQPVPREQVPYHALGSHEKPLCRTGDVSLSVQGDGENWGQVDDEYCHAHSEFLRTASEHLEKQGQDRHRLTEFTDFASHEDSGVVPPCARSSRLAHRRMPLDSFEQRTPDSLECAIACVSWAGVSRMGSLCRGSGGRTRSAGREWQFAALLPQLDPTQNEILEHRIGNDSAIRCFNFTHTFTHNNRALVIPCSDLAAPVENISR
jgi:hypothetical protein